MLGTRNLVYSLPTSAGKTLIAQLFLLRACVLRQCKVLLVLPYRAVVDEVFQSLSAIGAMLGVHVEAFYSARGAIPLMHGPMICVATIERAVGIIGSLVEDDRLGELGSLVVDEIHFVGEPERGSALELLIARVVHHNRRTTTQVADTSTVSAAVAVRSPIQLIGFTATLSTESLRTVARWMDADAVGAGEPDARGPQRPVALTEYVTAPATLSRDAKRVDEVVHTRNGATHRRVPRLPNESTANVGEPDRFRVKIDRVASLVIETAEADGGTLVFVPAKYACTSVATHLASLLNNNAPSDALKARSARSTAARQLLLQRLSAVSDMAEAGDASTANAGSAVAPFEAFVLHGIGVHNADLSSEQRAAMEVAFLDRTLHTLVATTTLAAGVNLPARRVIVLSRKIGDKEVEPSRFRQMIGRAGRAGFDVTGDAYLVADASAAEIDRCLLLLRAPLEQTRSQLTSENSGIERLLLSALALSRGAAPRSTMVQALEATLLKLHGHGSDTDRQLVHKTLRMLAARQMVILSERSAAVPDGAAEDVLVPLDDDIVTITVLGKACERVGYDTKFAELMFDDCLRHVETLRMVDLLHLCFVVVPTEWRPDLTTKEWHMYNTLLTHVRDDYSRLQGCRRGGVGGAAAVRDIDSRGANGARDDPSSRIDELSKVQVLWNDDFLKRLGVDIGYVDHRTDSYSKPSAHVDMSRREFSRHGAAMRFYAAILLREVLAENTSTVIARTFLESVRAAPMVDELVRNAAAFGARLYVFLSHFTEFSLLVSLLGPFVARLAHGGAKVDLHPLVAINGVGVQRARALFDRNVRSASQVAELTVEQMIDMLGARLGPPELRLSTARALVQAAKDHVERERIRAQIANGGTGATTGGVGGDGGGGGGASTTAREVIFESEDSGVFSVSTSTSSYNSRGNRNQSGGKALKFF